MSRCKDEVQYMEHLGDWESTELVVAILSMHYPLPLHNYISFYRRFPAMSCTVGSMRIPGSVSRSSEEEGRGALRPEEETRRATEKERSYTSGIRGSRRRNKPPISFAPCYN